MNIKDIRIRDPFILLEGDKYYMYSRYRGVDGFCVRVSDDLIEWSDEKPIFLNSGSFWATQDFWAPEVHKYNGKFYLFATMKNDRCHRGTQIFVCHAPDGMFKPLSDYPQTPSGWECLDGTLYVEDDIPYMVFCHEWTQCGYGEMCYIRLSDDLSRAVSEPQLMFRANEPEWAVSCVSDRPGFVTDGPYMHRVSDGRLIMIWSSFRKNGDSNAYVEVMAYSDNGKIDGQWIHAERLLMRDDGGHGMLFRDKDEKLRLVLHSPNIRARERALILNVKESEADGLLEIVE